MRTEARTALIGLVMLLGGCATSQPLPEQCYVKPESGMCRAAHTRYYFDPDQQACRPFIWGGCQGVVPFETMEACQALCDGEPMPGDAGIKKRSEP